MATRIEKNVPKQVALSTTGDLLDLRRANGTKAFTGPKVLEISTSATAGEVFVESGSGLSDGGSVGPNARAIPVSALPVELDVYGQGPDVKLYGDSSFNVTVVVR